MAVSMFEQFQRSCVGKGLHPSEENLPDHRALIGQTDRIRTLTAQLSCSAAVRHIEHHMVWPCATFFPMGTWEQTFKWAMTGAVGDATGSVATVMCVKYSLGCG